jgi:predicted glycogen debranching enzyme
VLVLHADPELARGDADARTLASEWRRTERARRGAFPSRLECAADAYIVRRGAGATIVAGYPWFGDWGRDSFIALRGLCLATGRLDEAQQILLEWSRHVSEGMLPNRFADGSGQGGAAEFNSVDASLWFVVAVHELLEARERAGRATDPQAVAALHAAVDQILEGYRRGTRHGIGADHDGLLRAGEPGQQLTWMDARVDGRVITPRIGKPVEVQALWINALAIGARRHSRWRAPYELARRSFLARFWDDGARGLFDVIDVNHVPGASDPSLRPNQILAVGGLPLQLVTGARARMLVDTVERALWTPLGLRSLAPQSPDYRGRYRGGPIERDEAYHQGTVWPWLLGPFVEAWVRVRRDTAAARREARERFLLPLLAHLDEAGLGHVSEVADGDAPHTPGGCPFQAWSVGELVRLERSVLREDAGPRHASSRRRASGAST